MNSDVKDKTLQPAREQDGGAPSRLDSMADEQVAKCPFAHYAHLRAEAPVREDPGFGFTWVAKRADVSVAARDWERFSSQSELQIRRRFQPMAQRLWDEAGMEVRDTLLTTDPPEHEHFRRLGMVLFTPQRVNELTPAIEQIINELIDPFVRDGKVNFVQQFASLLPATVVCDEYGFPREARDKFKHWADAWLQMQTPNISEEEEAALIKRVLVLFEFLREHLENAEDSSAKRVIHTIATMTRKDGTPFTALEREWITLIVFIAGNDTTVSTLTSCLYRLAINPDIQDRLRADPTKIANFVEEVLRYDPAVQVLVRKTTEEVEMQGAHIPQGADVMLCTASANRDEAFWGHSSEEFDPERPNARQHMTFGYGPHACVGMHLARRELVCAVRILLERLGTIRLANPDNPPEFLPVPFYRSMPELPLVFDVKG